MIGFTPLLVFLASMITLLLLVTLSFVINIAYDINKIAFNNEIDEAERDKKVKGSIYKYWAICAGCSLVLGLLALIMM